VLTSSSEEYLSSLEAGPRDAEWFQVSQSSKVPGYTENDFCVKKKKKLFLFPMK